MVRSELGGSERPYREALGFANSDQQRCNTLIRLAAVMRLEDNFETALRLLDEALPIAESAGLALSKLHHLRGNLCFPLGRTDQCLQEHGLALDHARASGSPELEVRALGGLGDAEYLRGRMLSAQAHHSECLSLSRKSGDLWTEVAYLICTGRGSSTRTDLRRPSQEAIEKGKRIGHDRARLLAHISISQILIDMQHLASALSHALTAMELIEPIGMRRFMAARSISRGGYAWRRASLITRSISSIAPWRSAAKQA